MKENVVFFPKLRGRIAERGLTQTELAGKLELSIQGFNAKMNGRSVFNLSEIKKLIDELDIKDDEIKDFFLS